MSCSTYRLPFRDFLDANGVARAMAIVLVIFAHVKFVDPFWEELGPFTSAGKLGVSIFVFYSGLLHEFQARKKGQGLLVSEWLKKRLVRIYPFYWIGLTVTLVIGSLAKTRHHNALEIVANMLGVQLFVGSKIVSGGYARPYWFISLIILCYLLFIMLYNVKHKGYLVVGSTILSLSIIYFGDGSFIDQIEYYQALLVFPLFFWGMWIADRLSEGGTIPGNRITHWVVAIVFFGISAFLFKGLDNFGMTQLVGKMAGLIFINLTTIYLCCCITYSFQGLRDRTPKVLRFLNWAGGVSFIVYCIHEPLLILVEKGGGIGHPIVGFVFYMSLLFAVSWGLQALENIIVMIPNAIGLKNKNHQ